MIYKHYREIEDQKAKCPLVGFESATLHSTIQCIKRLFYYSFFQHPVPWYSGRVVRRLHGHLAAALKKQRLTA